MAAMGISMKVQRETALPSEVQVSRCLRVEGGCRFFKKIGRNAKLQPWETTEG